MIDYGPLDPELEKHIRVLHVLAWGNLELVEEAMQRSLEKVRPIWWRFWQYDWRINWDRAEQYVRQHVKELNEIAAVDHDSLNM